MKNRRKRVRNPSLLGENLTWLEHIPAKRSDQLGVQLDILVGCPVQHGLLGDDVQHDALVGEGADQALLELGSTSG